MFPTNFASKMFLKISVHAYRGSVSVCSSGQYSLGSATVCTDCPAGFKCPTKNVSIDTKVLHLLYSASVKAADTKTLLRRCRVPGMEDLSRKKKTLLKIGLLSGARENAACPCVFIAQC